MTAEAGHVPFNCMLVYSDASPAITGHNHVQRIELLQGHISTCEAKFGRFTHPAERAIDLTALALCIYSHYPVLDNKAPGSGIGLRKTYVRLRGIAAVPSFAPTLRRGSGCGFLSPNGELFEACSQAIFITLVRDLQLYICYIATFSGLTM